MMELDGSWLLLALPVAFALGWMASRLDLRQWRNEQAGTPKAYYQGLNLLLDEQQDQAIDAFIEAVRSDPGTTDLHFALGSLFRRRGEYERSVRVHEHLLQRGDLKAAERHRAQRALAQDYQRAGLFDRAEQAWRALEGTPLDQEARLAQLQLAERTRDWSRALELAHSLPPQSSPDLHQRLAHYHCESARHMLSRNDLDAAQQALEHAVHTAPGSARAVWELAQLHLRRNQAGAAWSLLAPLVEQAHPQASLIVGDYVRAAQATGQLPLAIEHLRSLYARQPVLEVLEALQTQVASSSDAAPWLHHLQQHPSVRAVARVMAEPTADLNAPAVRTALEFALARAAKPLQRYRCTQCAFEADNHFWQCPGCLAWDSFPGQRQDAR